MAAGQAADPAITGGAAARPPAIAFLHAGVASKASQSGSACVSIDVDGLYRPNALRPDVLSCIAGEVRAFASLRLVPTPEAWPAKRSEQCLLCCDEASGRFFVVQLGKLLSADTGSPALRLANAWRNARKRFTCTDVAIGDEGGSMSALGGLGVALARFPAISSATLPVPVCGTADPREVRGAVGASHGAASAVAEATARAAAGVPAPRRRRSASAAAARVEGPISATTGAPSATARASAAVPAPRRLRSAAEAAARPGEAALAPTESPAATARASSADPVVHRRRTAAGAATIPEVRGGLLLRAAQDIVLLGAVPQAEASEEVVVAQRDGARPALLLSHYARTGAPTQWGWVPRASERDAVDLSDFIAERAQTPTRASLELVQHGPVLLLALLTVQSGPSVGQPPG